MTASDVISVVAILFGVVNLILAGLFKSASDRDLAKLNNELQEKQLSFAKLHERRGEIIAELYRMIVDCEAAARAFANPLSEGDVQRDKLQKGADAISALKKWQWFFYRNRVFFSSYTCNVIDSLLKSYQDSGIILLWVKFQNKENLPSLTPEWEKAMIAVEKSLPLVKQEVEKEFRLLLGVEKKSDGESEASRN